MISALFAGNAFVGKVSEYSSFYASYYESIVQAGLKELGYSPDLVRFVTGFAETGSALVESVDKLTFIGSPGVGKLVMEKASKTLTPVVLELGGKDPAIELDDADMEQVLPIILRGTFQNCGQNCVGVERVVAQTRVYDEILRRTTEVVKQMSQGATPVGKDDEIKCLGAMTMGLKQCANIQDLVTRSVAAGARLVVGGDWTEAKGTFFPPTILADVRPGMPIAEHEVFGPVLVLMKFTTDDEAVALVNSCPYGLGSNVFGSPARAKALGQRLHTGMMNVNDFAINYLCQSLPFGGVKISGFDRFAGIEGLRGCCVLRAETYDRIPGVKTLVPPILQYPMSTQSFPFAQLLVRVLYGNMADFVRAAIAMASFQQPGAAAKKTA
jgi:aldehyde dehydrogenase (NAD+)